MEAPIVNVRLLVQVSAACIALFFLWRLFRLAMGLRAARTQREEARQAEEARGRRVVAEVPGAEGDLFLFLDAGDQFLWQMHTAPKTDIIGCRLLLNGAAVATVVRPDVTLPEAPLQEDYEGRERWDVRLYTRERTWDVPCGTLREGVSRDTARAVFEAVAGTLRGIR